MGHILIVDDEVQICLALEQCLKEDGHDVLIASNARDAMELLETAPVGVILMDIQLPGMSGIEALQAIKSKGQRTCVILMTAHGGIQSTIQAMQSGAFDYLVKPMDLHEVRRVVAEAFRSHRPGDGVTLPEAEVLARYSLDNLVGQSRTMQEIYKMIGLLTLNDATVLIQGESGVGKELVAKAIHFNGPRKERPLRGDQLFRLARYPAGKRTLRS
jgi:DNA-binding NtrC family response regulator